jgi:nitrile hydratase accessory protein
MTGSTPEPGDDAPTFDTPWQARAFALAVTLTDEHAGDTLTWREFQSHLVREVNSGWGDDDSETVYYRQWLTALEQLLVEREILAPGELVARVKAFEEGNRDAHEFVEGNPHAHAERLPDGHAAGSHHAHGTETSSSSDHSH